MTSPGASSVPANMPPIITVPAPSARALAMSPRWRMPPSAISGTPVPLSAVATLSIAMICGTPTPATMRVVQIEPGPLPTLPGPAPAGLDQRQRSGAGGNVAADHVDLGIVLPDPAHALDHALAVAMGRVD